MIWHVLRPIYVPVLRAMWKRWPRLAPVKEVKYNKGSVLSKMLTDWETEPRFAAAYSAMWDDIERVGLGERSQSEAKRFVYLTSPWKHHMVCWAAYHASHLGGDFVDIGTGMGAVIRSILNYVDHDEKRKTWLVDRWDERDVSYLQNEKEKKMGLTPSTYIRSFKEVENRFLVKKKVPGVTQRKHLD